MHATFLVVAPSLLQVRTCAGDTRVLVTLLGVCRLPSLVSSCLLCSSNVLVLVHVSCASARPLCACVALSPPRLAALPRAELG